MSRNDEGSAAILAVTVGSAGSRVRHAARPTRLHEQQMTLVADMLTAAGGHEVDSPAIDACYGFGDWPAALGAAIALTTEVPRLTTQLAGMRVGLGLELADSFDDPEVAARVAEIALSANPNEIRLGEALAAVAMQDPPDHVVVRPVNDDPAAVGEPVYRVAKSREEVPNNLGQALTSFVGREAEIGEIRRLIGQARLVTVTGPPGAGKTRVAAEVAERMLGRFEDGAWFVELASVGDSRLMLQTLAETLGLPPAIDRSLVDAVSAHLRSRPSLVMLDNFEHIAEAAPELAALLAAAPSLHLLVTSRTVLHLSGEHEYPLPPLALPPANVDAGAMVRSEAVELFVQRASAADPTFALGEANASKVGEICRRLDGLPLAIELAAARVKLLPLPAILARLDHRLGLLTGGPRDYPARHRSLRSAVVWSYDLLEPEVQRLLRALSVFRGGWTIDGAVAVAGADGSNHDLVFDSLASLLDASLLIRQSPPVGIPRFTMLETLREFAGERLEDAGETDAARARHAKFCVDLVERLAPAFTGSDQATALDSVGIEHDNLRAALHYLVEASPKDALRIGAGLWRFWQIRGHLVEGGRWLALALATGDAVPDALRAKAETAAGGLAYWRGDMAMAQAHYERALALRRRTGDPVEIADALYDLAFVFLPFFEPPPEDAARTEQALRLLLEAEELYVKSGIEPSIAKSGWALGSLMIYRDMPRARSMLEATVERYRGLHDPFGLGWALRMYGLALLGTDDSAAAADAFGEALRLFAAAGDSSAMGLLLGDVAEIARADGDLLRTARLRGAAASIRHVTESALSNPDESPWIKANTRVGPVDDAALERAFAEGRAMSLAEAIAFALSADAVVEPDRALRVTTLGTFHVERSGQPLTHWGGPKAGSRQAQAMFAFLLDRGERGVTKDEFIEVIWPDADVVQGDLNFHKTLGGLRTTLEPGKAPGSSHAVLFSNGRYRLSPSLVGWLDATEFEQRLLNAAQATDALAAIRSLEPARSLYGGDYLDDCPVYGDSAQVEDRRDYLRGRLVDALVSLGQRYEARGDQTLAAARFREALTVSGGDCPSATAGLERLGVPSA